MKDVTVDSPVRNWEIARCPFSHCDDAIGEDARRDGLPYDRRNGEDDSWWKASLCVGLSRSAIVGSVCLRYTLGVVGVVRGMYVSPTFRRRGIGGELLLCAIAASRSLGIPLLQSEVHSAAVPFFVRHGFDVARRGKRTTRCDLAD